MVWYSHLFNNFPQFVVIHTVKSFGIVNKAQVDVSLGLSCFFYFLFLCQDQRSLAAPLAKIMLPKSLDVDSALRTNELSYVCHSRQPFFFSLAFLMIQRVLAI